MKGDVSKLRWWALVQGLTGQPLTYWTDTPILLSAQGGDFVSGTIRIAIHAMILTPPAAV